MELPALEVCLLLDQAWPLKGKANGQTEREREREICAVTAQLEPEPIPGLWQARTNHRNTALAAGVALACPSIA